MKKKVLACIFSATLILGTLSGCGGAASDAADVIVKGTIYTGNEDAASAQAIAIKDGKYTYVGDEKGAEDLIGDETKVIETGDGMAMASFTESHAHGSDGGIGMLYEISLYEALDYAKYQAEVKKFIKENPDLEVYKGGGWDNGFCPKGGPKAADLDKICSDKAVVLYSGDHHSYWVNSKAMEMAGIDKNTKDVEGGVIERDAKGNPTGTFRENAMALIDNAVPDYSVEQYKEGILTYQNEVKGYGITAYYEPMVNKATSANLLQAYNELDEAGELVLRTYGGYQIIAKNDPMKELDKAAKLSEEAKGGDFELNTIKLFIDGVVEGGTAYLLDGYEGRPDYKGEILWKQDELNKVCAKADELGFTLHTHAIGDGAVEMIMNAYEYVQDQNGEKDRRPAITHLQVVKDKEIKRMGEMKVVAATDPYWFCKEPGYYKEVEVPYLGEERASNEYPMKDFFDAGAVVTVASDFPVTIPSMPLAAIQTAVTRCDRYGDKATLLGADQKVTVEQMMQAATINGAYQNFAESEYGTIEEGKSADMIVLDQDITKIDPFKIGAVKVLNTMLKGEMIYEADAEK